MPIVSPVTHLWSSTRAVPSSLLIPQTVISTTNTPPSVVTSPLLPTTPTVPSPPYATTPTTTVIAPDAGVPLPPGASRARTIRRWAIGGLLAAIGIGAVGLIASRH